MQVSVLATPSLLCISPWQGINSSYELYLQGPDASAFTVSPTEIMGRGEVQILVQNSSIVDYEKTHVMVVQVGPVRLSQRGDSPCSLRRVPEQRGNRALLLRGSKHKAECSFAVSACLV